jgi:uncharacterized protein YsxB (DUF464 family)
MVKIHFWKEPESGAICMKVQGHASTAPKGADLVCASATMLVYTAAQAISFMHKQGYTEKPRIKIREGKAKISVVPKAEYYAEVLHSFWTVQCGAHVLAQNYPDAVSLNHLTV